MQSKIKLDTLNGHSQEVVDKFNQVAEHYSEDALLDLILTWWADDKDLTDIAKFLEERNDERK